MANAGERKNSIATGTAVGIAPMDGDRPTGIFRVDSRRAPVFMGLGIAASRLLGIFRNSEYQPMD